MCQAPTLIYPTHSPDSLFKDHKPPGCGIESPPIWAFIQCTNDFCFTGQKLNYYSFFSALSLLLLTQTDSAPLPQRQRREIFPAQCKNAFQHLRLIRLSALHPLIRSVLDFLVAHFSCCTFPVCCKLVFKPVFTPALLL